MRFDTSQHMRLGQQMKLAPRMIQSMAILQMPMPVLQEHIEQELESNVALEQIEPGEEIDRSTDDGGDRSDSLDEHELVVSEDGGNTEDFERLDSLETTYKEAFDNEYSSSRARKDSGERDRKMDAMANTPARGESLTEQLRMQWRFAEVDDATQTIGELLISYVDSSGLLGVDLETILEQNRGVPGLELSMERLEAALKEVQRWLDPPGVAARDVHECVLLQIDALEGADEDFDHNWDDVRLLIANHFDDLVHNRLPKIVQESSLTMERIHAAMELMRRVNLSPGRDLVDVEAPPIIPDVIVRYDDDADEYVAHLNGDLIPPLRVSSRYRDMAKDRQQDKPTREFLSRNVQSAQWLIDSIQQRSNTVLRVVNVVLARQREYFDQGARALRPLPMIEVADLLGIHVATVSRAVADKWMQTPRGLVPLRKFFSGGTSTDSGEMSWEAIKATLRDVIDAEDKTKPLSDEKLAAKLREQGIEIARRTVVKYRQQLGIPSARQRKVFTA